MVNQKQKLFHGLYLFIMLALVCYFSCLQIISFIEFIKSFVSSNDFYWFFLATLMLFHLISLWFLVFLNLAIKTNPSPKIFRKELSKKTSLLLIVFSSIEIFIIVVITIYCIIHNYNSFLNLTKSDLNNQQLELVNYYSRKQFILNSLYCGLGILNYLLFIIPFVKQFRVK